jgi:hypothetical protein
MKTWEEFNRLNEDGEGGGGVSSATLGNTGGAGPIISAQPSSIPGDVAGSKPGSCDLGQPIGVYTKQPAIRRKKKKDKESKRNKVIDNFYVTNYKESHNGNIIQNWEAFGDTNEEINWPKYDSTGPEMYIFTAEKLRAFYDDITSKTISKETRKILRFIGVDPKIYEGKLNEGEDYIIPIEVGKIYAVDSDKKGSYSQVLTDIYLGKNEHAFYKIGQIRTLGELMIFYPNSRSIEGGNFISIPLVDLKGKIRGLTEEEKDETINQLKKDKKFGGLREDVVTYYDILKKLVGTELI